MSSQHPLQRGITNAFFKEQTLAGIVYNQPHYQILYVKIRKKNTLIILVPLAYIEALAIKVKSFLCVTVKATTSVICSLFLPYDTIVKFEPCIPTWTNTYFGIYDCILLLRLTFYNCIYLLFNKYLFSTFAPFCQSGLEVNFSIAQILIR